jgi:hypothetical protein
MLLLLHNTKHEREIDEFPFEDLWLEEKKTLYRLYSTKGCQCHRIPQKRVRKMAPKASTHKPTTQIQGDSGGICETLGNDSMCDSKQKSSYKHVSDFGRLRSYDRLNLRIEGDDYLQ